MNIPSLSLENGREGRKADTLSLVDGRVGSRHFSQQLPFQLAAVGWHFSQQPAAGLSPGSRHFSRNFSRQPAAGISAGSQQSAFQPAAGISAGWDIGNQDPETDRKPGFETCGADPSRQPAFQPAAGIPAGSDMGTRAFDGVRTIQATRINIALPAAVATGAAGFGSWFRILGVGIGFGSCILPGFGSWFRILGVGLGFGSCMRLVSDLGFGSWVS